MWDGSWLEDCSFVNKWEHENKKFAQIACDTMSGAVTIFCEYRKMDDSLVVIIDEISPLFKLNKRGTYRARINKINYILYYVDFVYNNIICETNLSAVKKTESVRKDNIDEIRKLIIFQDLISINRIGESHIILRKIENDKYKCLGSFTDKSDLNKNMSHLVSNISPTLRNKYFDENNPIDSILKQMINKNDSESLFNLNYEIEKVIKRINKDYLWFANFIINRIRGYF